MPRRSSFGARLVAYVSFLSWMMGPDGIGLEFGLEGGEHGV